MTDPEAMMLGGHALPQRFSSPPLPIRRSRRPRPGALLGVAGGLLVAASLGAVQLGANLGYDDAADRFGVAAYAATGSLADARADAAELSTLNGFATQILRSDDGSLVDPALKDALATAVSGADATVADSAGLLDSTIPDGGKKPTWFWELFAASARLDEDREDLSRLDDDLADEAPAMEKAGASVSEAGLALLSSAASAAAGFEASHISAKNDDVIALRGAATALSSTTELDERAVDSFTSLQQAAAQVVASEQAELAEKAGPLLQTRLDIEAFARSLAPGVLLEFDWSPIVSGAGDRGSMGGLTTWWWDAPDRAVIELSNSVAEQWPSSSSKSLVAHEVGHAISVKCEDMYDSSTQDSIEKWATAWAISMGYTDDANGVWAYGYPPQSYIDAAAGCR